MKSISETRVGDEVFLACDALALARGTSPGVETVRKALRIAQNTATEGVRAYKENPPPFTRGPVGTSDAALMDRCFRAFDDAEEDAALIYIAPAYVTATDDERRDMRRDAWRAAHVRLCCADLLAERFDALSPSLRPSILAVARQAPRGRLHDAQVLDGVDCGLKQACVARGQVRNRQRRVLGSGGTAPEHGGGGEGSEVASFELKLPRRRELLLRWCQRRRNERGEHCERGENRRRHRGVAADRTRCAGFGLLSVWMVYSDTSKVEAKTQP